MLGGTIILAALVFLFVDLKPHVDENFFFSSDDPQFQQDNKLNQMFPSGSQLILSVSSPNIGSEAYIDCIGRLTERISSLKGVTGVRSLANGPEDFKDAEKSPFGNGF